MHRVTLALLLVTAAALPAYGVWGAVLVGLAATVARADVILVPDDYATIQGAIDASIDGDVVSIAPGTYTGPGNRDVAFGGKQISVVGAGAALTIVDCEASSAEPHRGFIFDDGPRDPL